MVTPDNGLEKHQTLVLAISHLTEETRDLLDITDPLGWPVAGGRLPYGYYIYAHDENSEGNIPADLWACLSLAHAEGCKYVQFDVDGGFAADLPTYD